MRAVIRAVVIGRRIRWSGRKNLLHLAIFLAVIGVVAGAFLLQDRLTLAQAGYAGIGLAALIASAGLILPVPALAAVCASSVFLNPLFIGLIAGVAETVGELTGYFLGYSGRGVVSQGRLYRRLEGWMRRRGWLLLFLVALVPNPVFDLVGVTAGALRYPLGSFLGVVLVGKLIKFVSLSYACYFGITWLTGVFL
jgi:membrane protein YqaA with SNARE-associated domain